MTDNKNDLSKPEESKPKKKNTVNVSKVAGDVSALVQRTGCSISDAVNAVLPKHL